jgi:hypothetical protein
MPNPNPPLIDVGDSSELYEQDECVESEDRSVSLFRSWLRLVSGSKVEIDKAWSSAGDVMLPFRADNAETMCESSRYILPGLSVVDYENHDDQR